MPVYLRSSNLIGESAGKANEQGLDQNILFRFTCGEYCNQTTGHILNETTEHHYRYYVTTYPNELLISSPKEMRSFAFILPPRTPFSKWDTTKILVCLTVKYNITLTSNNSIELNTSINHFLLELLLQCQKLLLKFNCTAIYKQSKTANINKRAVKQNQTCGLTAEPSSVPKSGTTSATLAKPRHVKTLKPLHLNFSTSPRVPANLQI